MVYVGWCNTRVPFPSWEGGPSRQAALGSEAAEPEAHTGLSHRPCSPLPGSSLVIITLKIHLVSRERAALSIQVP